MWADYATPARNRVRAKNQPPEPDQDGLFDAAGVTEICGRRQCSVAFASEYAATVTHKAKQVPLTAIGPGKWDPVSILKACSAACGRTSYDIDVATAKPANPEGLDEIKIARIVGADGLRPYLSKRGKYAVLSRGTISPSDVAYLGAHFPLLGNVVHRICQEGRAITGNPTWAFRTIINAIDDRSDYDVRRALRALEDVGLVDVKLSPRGGMATATVTWTERAYLPKPTPGSVTMAADDDLALECIAAGIA
jgi:hypothetical protein